MMRDLIRLEQSDTRWPSSPCSPSFYRWAVSRARWSASLGPRLRTEVPHGSPPYAADEVAAEAVWSMGCPHGPPDVRTADILLARAEDGTLLGAATLARIPTPGATAGGGLRGFLSDLLVMPAAHGKGVGRALMAKVLATCREAELAELCWYCLESNEQAMSFYSRLGFTPTGASVWQYPEAPPG
ncbi:mshD [Symbiodinium pilosum]|uniref:MshD protein n=1 Tax=Symbiodinium pilosum TaxID=2952 RepID=A0A812XC40_SYMPI|nr:mshD [Symbiodinium pilosum]